MRNPDPDETEDGSSFLFYRFISPELKAHLGDRVLLHYETVKEWKKGPRLDFNHNLYRHYIFEACEHALNSGMLPAHAMLPVALLLSKDEEFYLQLYARAQHLCNSGS